MKTRYFLFLSVVLLVLTGCGITDVEEGSGKGTTIHYRATVKGSPTKATLDGNNYIFEAGDKLIISGTDISGELTIQSGVGSASGTFEGDLTYIGEGSPAASLELTARLQSTSMTSATPGYSTAITATLAEAVQKYSKLTATSTFGAKAFSLEQGSTFIAFNLRYLDNNYIPGGTYPVTIDDESDTPYHASGSISFNDCLNVSFFAALDAATVLKNPVLTLKDRAIPFGSYHTTLAANTVNHVTREFPNNISLGGVDSDVTIPANSVVTVSGIGLTRTVTVGEGCYITLSDMTARALIFKGNAVVYLEGANTLDSDYAGWSVTASGGTITIKGDGSLSNVKNTTWVQANGCINAATTDFIIESGTLVMKAGCGISKGQNLAMSVKNLSVRNGTLDIRGGQNDVSTSSRDYTNRWDGIKANGNIVIEDGLITADGCHGICATGDILISGGTITATGGGTNNRNSGLSAAGKLTISGGKVYAAGAVGCPGIGDAGTCGDILISGGEVVAIGADGAAAIGTGSDANSVCGNITILDTVTKICVKKGIGGSYIGRGNESSTVGLINIGENVPLVLVYQYDGAGGENFTWE